MRALHWDGTELRLVDVPQPGADADTALVRVHLAGVCNTDLELTKGYMGFRGVLGHEFVGVALGGRFEGQRVVGEINCSCHACPTCQAGRPGHCPHRTVIGIVNRDGVLYRRAEVVQVQSNTDLPETLFELPRRS